MSDPRVGFTSHGEEVFRDATGTHYVLVQYTYHRTYRGARGDARQRPNRVLHKRKIEWPCGAATGPARARGRPPQTAQQKRLRKLCALLDAMSDEELQDACQVLCEKTKMPT